MSLNGHKKKLAVSLLATLLCQGSWAQSAATASLLEQGRYWQTQGDSRRASQIWEKLLSTDSNQQEALYGMGLAEVRGKRFNEAGKYLARLTKLDAGSSFVQRLQQDISLATDPGEADLEQARMLAVSGEINKAMLVYDRALQGREPQGDIALEYYSFLGYADNGLQKAIAGLRRLQREDASNPAIQLALAKHMIGNENSRAEGVRMLAQLSQRKDVGADATESWRAGLLWMGAPRAGERALFESYMRQHPDDSEVRAVMNRSGTLGVRRAPATVWRQDPRLARGFAALKQGNLSEAESAFQEKLQVTPNDSDALGGMGLVRMQQERPVEAQELLSRAVSRPGAGRNWNRALADARYWSLVDQAEVARKRGDTDGARRLLEQAIQLDENNTGAYNALGRVYAETGDMENAERTYLSVLLRKKDDQEAKLGMIDVLARTGRQEEALALVESLPPKQAAEVGNIARLRASVIADRARRALKAGDEAGARQLLDEARATDPGNPWITYELARLNLRNGDAGLSLQQMDEMTQAYPGTPDVLYANALLLSERGELSRASDVMARIPVDGLTPEMTTFQDRLNAFEQSAHAARLAKEGDSAAARRQLASLEAAAGDDPELLGTVAQAYIDAGEKPHALAMMKRLVEKSDPVSTDVLIIYAGVLLKAEEDEHTAGVLRELQNKKMSADQHNQFQSLVSLYTIRQAEAMRQRGDVSAAYDILRPVLQRSPDDPLVQGALARMYAAAGDHAKALEIYNKLQVRDPDNADLQLAVADIEIEKGDWGSAKKALEKAVSLSPNDPDVLAKVARTYRVNDYTSRAEELYQTAIAVQEDRNMKKVVTTTDGIDKNPFADSSSDQRQDKETLALIQEPVSPTDTNASVDTLRRELDGIMQDRSGEVRVGGFIRSKKGESGLSKLNEFDAPVEVLLPAGDGKISLRVTPVTLRAGNVGSDSSSRFGGGPLAAEAQQQGLVGAPRTQRDSGVGLSVGYQVRGLSADIGVTPQGFEYSNLVGGLHYDGVINATHGTWFGVGLSRRAVTDSLLSFAGTRDDRTDHRWGAVTATGPEGQIGMDNDDYGIYAYGSWRSLRGHNVKSNTRTEAGAGIYWYALKESDRLMTVGLNLGTISYGNNQRFFTYGHGGYYSPQQFYALSVPVRWAQRNDRWTYKLQGAVGVQHSKEDGADYFPADRAWQTASGNPVYGGSSNTGIGYSLEAAAEYRLNRHFYLGGMFAIDNATDYRQYLGGLYLRYTFSPTGTKPLELPVNPFQSPYWPSSAR